VQRQLAAKLDKLDPNAQRKVSLMLMPIGDG